MNTQGLRAYNVYEHPLLTHLAYGENFHIVVGFNVSQPIMSNLVCIYLEYKTYLSSPSERVFWSKRDLS